MQLLFQIEPRPEKCDVSIVGFLAATPSPSQRGPRDQILITGLPYDVQLVFSQGQAVEL
jgi:hypothetical protein